MNKKRERGWKGKRHIGHFQFTFIVIRMKVFVACNRYMIWLFKFASKLDLFSTRKVWQIRLLPQSIFAQRYQLWTFRDPMNGFMRYHALVIRSSVLEPWQPLVAMQLTSCENFHRAFRRDCRIKRPTLFFVHTKNHPTLHTIQKPKKLSNIRYILFAIYL